MKSRYWMPTEDGGVRPATALEAAAAFGAGQIALDEGEDGRYVSTAFLYVDNDSNPTTRDDPNALPVVYETMTFDAEGRGQGQRRARTREQALAEHRAACLEFLGREPSGDR